MFTAPTYLVLDLPVEIGAEVTALRSRYDGFMAGLPPEITIAGSSGIGALSPGQSQEAVFAAIRRVVGNHLPITTTFVSIERFPGTDVFWLKPIDRAPFDAIQAALVAEGLRFLPSPFPFNPHCTVSASVPLSPGQEDELLASGIPGQEFALDRLSLYQLIHGHAELLRSFPATESHP